LQNKAKKSFKFNRMRISLGGTKPIFVLNSEWRQGFERALPREEETGARSFARDEIEDLAAQSAWPFPAWPLTAPSSGSFGRTSLKPGSAQAFALGAKTFPGQDIHRRTA
jgi:hypothetical protein